jgi:hypothetical protein
MQGIFSLYVHVKITMLGHSQKTITLLGQTFNGI